MPRDIQCIAYQIQTAAEGNTNRVNYPGLNDQKRDIDARCKVLIDAIEAAAKDHRISPMATKLFVAPEFFFRGARGGVYSAEALSYLSEVLDRHLRKAEYFRWIFVLGTALAVMPEVEPPAGAALTDDSEILNVALARIGGRSTVGENTTPGDSILVYKEYVSAVDFFGPDYGDSPNFHHGANPGQVNIGGALTDISATAGARPSGGIDGVGAANVPAVAMGGETSASGLGGATNFTLDGLQFICEICLDHVMRRAQATIPQGNVDIHLVTSCGMTTAYKHARNQGLFFLVDGSDHQPSRVTLRQKIAGAWQPQPAPIAAKRMSDQRHWRHHHGVGTNLFQNGKGTVYVYPRITI